MIDIFWQGQKYQKITNVARQASRQKMRHTSNLLMLIRLPVHKKAIF